jgi:hypothetical protein
MDFISRSFYTALNDSPTHTLSYTKHKKFTEFTDKADIITTQLRHFKTALQVMALYPQCLERFKVIVNKEKSLSDENQTEEPDHVLYTRTSR